MEYLVFFIYFSGLRTEKSTPVPSYGAPPGKAVPFCIVFSCLRPTVCPVHVAKRTTCDTLSQSANFQNNKNRGLRFHVRWGCRIYMQKATSSRSLGCKIFGKSIVIPVFCAVATQGPNFRRHKCRNEGDIA